MKNGLSLKRGCCIIKKILFFIVLIIIIRRREGEKVKTEANIGAVTEATASKTPNVGAEHAEKEAKEIAAQTPGEAAQTTAQTAEAAAKAAADGFASASDAVPEQGKRRKRKKKKSAEDDAAVEGVAQYDEYKVVILIMAII